MLLLLLILHHVLAEVSDTSNSKVLIRSIASCPELGYFYQREPTPNSINPGPCFLCFCQDNATALCWQSRIKNCDNPQKIIRGDTRVRRSPVGLNDIFFRDAARDFFNKQTPEQCKPHESSFSEGCPPADWCTGCTVCDCDANGRWDCHILSFCPDKTGKNQVKKKKALRRARRKHKEIIKNTTKVAPKSVKSTPKPQQKKKQAPNKAAKVNIKKPIPQKNNKLANRRKYAVTNTNKVFTKPMVINKHISTKKPTIIKVIKNDKQNRNNTFKIAQKIVNKVMAAVQKMIKSDRQHRNTTKKPKTTTVGKRFTPKKIVKHIKKSTKRAKSSSDEKRLPGVIYPKKHNYITFRPRNNIKARSKIYEEYKRKKREVIDSNNQTTNSIKIVKSNYTDIFSENRQVTIANILNTTSATLTSESVIDETNNQNSTDRNQEVIHVTDNTVIFLTEANISKKENITLNRKDNPKTVNKKNIRYDKAPISDMHYGVNDLKLNKWSEKKAFKTNRLLRVGILKPDIFSEKILSNGTETKISKNLNNSRVINCNSEKENKSKIYTESKVIKNVNNKLKDLQSALSRLLNIFRKKNSKKPIRKLKQLNTLRYMKKFFNGLFSKEDKKMRVLGYQLRKNHLNKYNIIRSLCKSFGPCVINENNKKQLKTKLGDLITETQEILRTIKIIKGVLHLMDFPRNNTNIDKFGRIRYQNNYSDTNNDVQKLNSILKGTYFDDINRKITETEIRQIDYIKSNALAFVQSVGKFAKVLNEIVDLLTKSAKINKSNRISRYINNEKIKIKNERIDSPFKKLRSLLLKYNLVQNSFLRKMYTTIADFENNNNQNKTDKVSIENDNGVNNSIAIKKYTKNIIENLRKLKNLAQALTSSSRRKRETRGDDAVEYLLILMEYLLKQNYALDTTPANDGIDLLIEAIKNAPDIKPIKKKVLKFTPIKPTPTKNSEYLEIASNIDISDSKKISNEDNKTFKGETRKFGAEVISDDGEEEAYSLDAKHKSQTLPPVFYNKQNRPVTQYTHQEITEFPFVNVAQDKNESLEYNSLKTVGDRVRDDRKFDIFNADLEEDVVIPETSTTAYETTMNTLIVSTSAIPQMRTVEVKAGTNKIKYYASDEDIEESKKGRLDWLEESYEQEIKEAQSKRTSAKSNTKYVTRTTTTTTVKPVKAADSLSVISKEINDEKRKKISKINVEEVMFKKQMDLLNSLDYGTEKSEALLDDSSSSKDERYADAFPSYFA